MSVLISKDKKELIASCNCGCEEGIHIRIEPAEDCGEYCYATILSGNWYREQDNSIFRVIGKKLKKILAIIRNKDFYYSEIVMNEDDFEQFKEYINQF